MRPPLFHIAFRRRRAILGVLKSLARALAFFLPLLCLDRADADDPAALPLVYPANLHVVSSPAAYRAEVRDDRSRRMVDLAQAVPGLLLDIRYATSDNFTGRALYPNRKSVV